MGRDVPRASKIRPRKALNTSCSGHSHVKISESIYFFHERAWACISLRGRESLTARMSKPRRECKFQKAVYLRYLIVIWIDIIRTIVIWYKSDAFPQTLFKFNILLNDSAKTFPHRVLHLFCCSTISGITFSDNKFVIFLLHTSAPRWHALLFEINDGFASFHLKKRVTSLKSIDLVIKVSWVYANCYWHILLLWFSVLIRPHPAIWRLVHGMAVVYLVALTFLLFQVNAVFH